MMPPSAAGPDLILASASPRRRELVARLGLPFRVHPADLTETLDPAHSIPDAVASLALDKARAVAAGLTVGLVLGADTAVVLDDEVLGKPRDGEDAAAMLRRLRARAHDVVTGVALVDAATGRAVSSFVQTTVRMRRFEDDEVTAYVATGEPRDKAGAYGIQGLGGALVAGIEGCYFNVVGLPLCEVVALLTAFGLRVAAETVCRLPGGAPCPRHAARD